MTKKLNQFLSRTVLKTEHYNLYKGKISCRVVVLDLGLPN